MLHLKYLEMFMKFFFRMLTRYRCKNRTQAFQILMLNSDASFDDVKYAYRKLSLELHPD